MIGQRGPQGGTRRAGRLLPLLALVLAALTLAQPGTAATQVCDRLSMLCWAGAPVQSRRPLAAWLG